MRRRLERDGLGEAAAEVVAWLLRLGYLDDAAYARARARSLLAPGRLGPRLAERRLASAGIPAQAARAAVEAALAEVAAAGTGAEPAELALARDLLRRRTGGAAPQDLPERDLARLARFLLGRGFSGRVVSRVLGVWLDQD